MHLDNNTMTIVALSCLLALSSPAVAYSDRVVTWHRIEAAGYFYFLPPADCLTGPLPPYEVRMLPQRTMNARWPTHNPNAPERFGMTFFGHSADNPGDRAVIFLPMGLPPIVTRGSLQHEWAHLRGCQHPGYVTHSDGTPVRH